MNKILAVWILTLFLIAFAAYLGWITAEGLKSYHNQVARQIERVTIRGIP